IAGGNGVICGLTNVEPETFAYLHKAYEAGDFAHLIECAKRISHLMAVYNTTDLFISAIKAAVNLKGLPISTLVREPASQVNSEQIEAIRALLK
ncbi:dihydrodipicolinate synthase family protein, partial [Gardnerella vaginalis]